MERHHTDGSAKRALLVARVPIGHQGNVTHKVPQDLHGARGGQLLGGLLNARFKLWHFGLDLTQGVRQRLDIFPPSVHVAFPTAAVHHPLFIAAGRQNCCQHAQRGRPGLIGRPLPTPDYLAQIREPLKVYTSQTALVTPISFADGSGGGPLARRGSSLTRSPSRNSPKVQLFFAAAVASFSTVLAPILREGTLMMRRSAGVSRGSATSRR
mmetsp:Transcript_39277/g.111196  ORF Transcript_39277/g.111196 Transcript_39277/m.111196 type:complete len:211 (+) Transcript_39277:1886-2518(+)